jgi:hypothetical protein
MFENTASGAKGLYLERRIGLAANAAFHYWLRSHLGGKFP